MAFELAALAYLVDTILGEFISGFEERFYRDSILSGALWVIGLLLILTLLISINLIVLNLLSTGPMLT